MLHALGLLLVFRIEILEAGFQIQNRCGYFHPKCWFGRFLLACRAVDDVIECGRQAIACFRKQLGDGIHQQRHLILDRLGFADLARCERRP